MVETGLGIALLATPAGWVIVIGASIAVGILAAKGGDWFGQLAANTGYDFGTWLNGLKCMSEKLTLEILSELSTQDWLVSVGAIAFFIWAIATFLFNRISVKHIEYEMAKEGIEAPAWDKGIGARMIAYAGIIVFPNLNRHASLVNIEATKRFARDKDKKLALFYMITTVSFLTIIFTTYYLYGPDN